MPGKISEFDALNGATAATTDLIEVLDVSDTTMAVTGTNKKMALADVSTFLVANSAQTVEVLSAVSYTVVAADAGKLKRVTPTNISSPPITLPAAVFTVGQRVDFLAVGSIPNFVVGSGATWDALPTPSATARAIGSLVTAIKTGDTTWALVGDLADTRSTGVKTAIVPGDVFLADAAMPSFAAQPSDKQRQLGRLGYVPDPAYEMVWINGQSFVYGGSAYYWSGTNWAVGVAPYKVDLKPFDLPAQHSYTTTAPGIPDLNRMSRAKRLAHVARLYNPVPATAWADGEIAVLKTCHAVRWNGTAWEFVAEAADFTGHPFGKVLTFHSAHIPDTNITAADATNAAKLVGLGYTPLVTYPSRGDWYGGPQFLGAADTYGQYPFQWNGTAWVAGGPQGTYLWPGSTTVDDPLAAIADPKEKLWAFNVSYFPGGTDARWLPTTSCTIAGSQVYRGSEGSWLYGVAPGTAPPVPDPMSLMPGDAWITALPGLSVSGQNGYNLSHRVVGLGWKPHPSEFSKFWTTANGKWVSYLNQRLWWLGSHFFTTPGNRSTVYLGSHYPSTYDHVGPSVAFGWVPTVAEQEALAMEAFSGAVPSTPWAADEHIWHSNVIWQWDGAAWKVLCKTPRIIEAATYPVVPGDCFYDSRITGASSLLGLGYVPVLRTSWKKPYGPTPQGAYFTNITAAGDQSSYYWNGTAWVSGQSAIVHVLVTTGSTVVDANISALPADERVVACTMAGYQGGASQWTTGQSAMIGGAVVHWHGNQGIKYWAPGVAP